MQGQDNMTTLNQLGGVHCLAENAVLTLPGREIRLPILSGTEDEYGLDISALRSQTGYITVDPGFENTGACESGITYIDTAEAYKTFHWIADATKGLPRDKLFIQSKVDGRPEDVLE